MNVEDWRSKIDAIDTALLHLLNLRTSCALEIGKLKRDQGAEILVLSREQDILKRMKDANPGPLDDEAIVKIYQLILDQSKRMQDLRQVATKQGAGAERGASRADARKPGA